MYGQPAQAQFINTYVPLPMNQILNMVAQKQNRYAQGLSNIEQQQGIIQSIPAIAGSEDQQYLADVNNKVKQLVNDYANKDLSDITTVGEFNQKLNSVVDKERLGRIAQSYKNWLTNENYKKQAQLRGVYNPIIDKNPAAGWSSANGVYNYTSPTYRPKELTLDKYFDEIRTPRLLEEAGTDQYGRQKRGRNINDLRKVVGAHAGEWLATQDGRNEVEIYRAQHPQESQGKNDLQIAKDIMNEYGQRYLGIYDYTSPLVKPGSASQQRGYQGDLTVGIPEGASTEDNYKSAKEVNKKISELQTAVSKYNQKMPGQHTAEEISENARNEAQLNDLNAKKKAIEGQYQPKLDKIAQDIKENTINDLMTKLGYSKEEAENALNTYTTHPVKRVLDNAQALEEKLYKGITGVAQSGFGVGFGIMGLGDIANYLSKKVIGLVSPDEDKRFEDLVAKTNPEVNKHKDKFWNNVNELVDQIRSTQGKSMPTDAARIIRDNYKKAKEAVRVTKEVEGKQIANQTSVQSEGFGTVIGTGNVRTQSNVFSIDANNKKHLNPLGQQVKNVLLHPENYQVEVNIGKDTYTSDRLDKLQKKGISGSALVNNIQQTSIDWKNGERNGTPQISIDTFYKDKNGTQHDVTMKIPLQGSIVQGVRKDLINTHQYYNLAMLDAYSSRLNDRLFGFVIPSNGTTNKIEIGNVTSDGKPLEITAKYDDNTGDIAYKYNDPEVQDYLKSLGFLSDDGYVYAPSRKAFVNQVYYIFTQLYQQMYRQATTGGNYIQEPVFK